MATVRCCSPRDLAIAYGQAEQSDSQVMQNKFNAAGSSAVCGLPFRDGSPVRRMLQHRYDHVLLGVVVASTLECCSSRFVVSCMNARHKECCLQGFAALALTVFSSGFRSHSGH